MDKSIAMFGCSTADLDNAISSSLEVSLHGETPFAYQLLSMSILSDAQEMLNRGNAVAANQQINCAKYILSKSMAR